MRSVAIIPARRFADLAGRRRLLDGKPLIVHTIDAARAATEVDIVVVSTTTQKSHRFLKLRLGSLSVRQRLPEIPRALNRPYCMRWVYSQRTMVCGRKYGFLQCISVDDVGGHRSDCTCAGSSADSALAVAQCHQFLWRRSKAAQPRASTMTVLSAASTGSGPSVCRNGCGVRDAHRGFSSFETPVFW